MAPALRTSPWTLLSSARGILSMRSNKSKVESLTEAENRAKIEVDASTTAQHRLFVLLCGLWHVQMWTSSTHIFKITWARVGQALRSR
eukprot:5227561-Amphidinium_carterae.1